MSKHKETAHPERRNLFAELPKKFREEIFQTLVETPHFLFETIVSDDHATPDAEWYDQERDEWIVVLTGKAGLRFENNPEIMELNPGDSIVIPAHVRHRVEWTDKEGKTVWLALHYHGD